jgi:hypothetical protein
MGNRIVKKRACECGGKNHSVIEVETNQTKSSKSKKGIKKIIHRSYKLNLP